MLPVVVSSVEEEPVYTAMTITMTTRTRTMPISHHQFILDALCGLYAQNMGCSEPNIALLFRDEAVRYDVGVVNHVDKVR